MHTIAQRRKEMKVAILVGGFGRHLTEETEIRPKPMVEIGGREMYVGIAVAFSRIWED